METLEHILAEHPLLSGLEPRLLGLLVGCASNVRFNAGQYVLRDGESSDKFYLIRHGRVAVEVAVPGKGPIIIQTIGEGEALGWSWLVPPFRRRFDARAMELVRAIALDGKCLRTKFDQDCELGYNMMKRFAPVMAQRIEATRLQLLDMYGTHA